MPIAGDTLIQLGDRKAFFQDLSQLDTWTANPDEKLGGVLPYVPRNRISDPSLASRGKLLLCHDFKGGYVESPFSLSYTFNFWSTIDIFVYFSHHRVTIPPPAWIHVAHRHGVKMLGVLIFEHEEHRPDLVRLLSGPFTLLEQSTFTFSDYYATVLADLAYQRGFDGYLLNFELSFNGDRVRAHALCEWVRLLRQELWKKVGPHAEVIWYDSVIINGNVRYQNKLNELNLPYFLSSTGFFSNYFWRESYPLDTLQYLLSINTELLDIEAASLPSGPRRSLTQRDIFMGIDVWGRGTYGGGGFDAHRALEVIRPDALGLSVALFGPGWTWEKRQDDSGQSWQQWWNEEVRLWAGDASGLDPRYKPIGHFFTKKAPPDPSILPFFTTFCPGIGLSWWVNGEKVWDGSTGNNRHWSVGWLDMERQCSVGDLLWPVPTIQCNAKVGNDASPESVLPVMHVALNFDDAWNGGNSLKVSLLESVPGGLPQNKRSIWMPIQSLSVTPGQEYNITVVYKPTSISIGIISNVELELRPLVLDIDNIDIKVLSKETEFGLGRNWMGSRMTVRITSLDPPEPIHLALGVTFDVHGYTVAEQELLLFLLGQVNVYTSGWRSEGKSRLQATFTSTSKDQEGIVKIRSVDDLSGVLTWGDATPQDAPSSLLGRYAYWNIYVRLLPSQEDKAEEGTKETTWIGTSGFEYGGESGKKKRFVVVGKNVMTRISLTVGSGTLQFYIQGVMGCGQTMSWEDAPQTDVRFKLENERNPFHVPI